MSAIFHRGSNHAHLTTVQPVVAGDSSNSRGRQNPRRTPSHTAESGTTSRRSENLPARSQSGPGEGTASAIITTVASVTAATAESAAAAAAAAAAAEAAASLVLAAAPHTFDFVIVLRHSDRTLPRDKSHTYDSLVNLGWRAADVTLSGLDPIAGLSTAMPRAPLFTGAALSRYQIMQCLPVVGPRARSFSLSASQVGNGPPPDTIPSVLNLVTLNHGHRYNRVIIRLHCDVYTNPAPVMNVEIVETATASTHESVSSTIPTDVLVQSIPDTVGFVFGDYQLDDDEADSDNDDEEMDAIWNRRRFGQAPRTGTYKEFPQYINLYYSYECSPTVFRKRSLRHFATARRHRCYKA